MSWFSVACLSVRVLVTYVCSYYFISVSVAEWPPSGKELLTWLTICSLCILTLCNFSYRYFPFSVLSAGFGF